MNRQPPETLLHRINASMADCKKLIREKQKRLVKAESRAMAAALQREIVALDADVDALKVQQKALKRGIVTIDAANGR